MDDERALLDRLDQTVSDVVAFYGRLNSAEFPVNAAWTARDALVHVVFWHESFARNVEDLAAGRKPRPLKGTYAELGVRASEEAAGQSIAVLLSRLESAQCVIRSSIFDPKVTLIPYKVGSRPYPPSEHLAIVNDHVAGHLRKVKSAHAQYGGPETVDA